MINAQLTKQYARTWKALTNGGRVLIVLQARPDGDNLGASFGLYHALRTAGVRAAVTTAGTIPEDLRVFPGMDDARITMDAARSVPWDSAVVLDTGDLAYGGVLPVLESLTPAPRIVNIDHHATNEYFGAVNLVDASASAAAEVVASLLFAVGVTVTPDAATCLFVGILTDTGFFSNPGTTGRALAVSAALLACGAERDRVMQALLSGAGMQELVVWGLLLERLQLHPSGLAVTFVREAELAERGLTHDAVGGVANFLNIIGDAKAVCVLREEPGNVVKGSLRTTRPGIDVSRIALKFGGGGHAKAAGFRVAGRVVEERGRWKVVV